MVIAKSVENERLIDFRGLQKKEKRPRWEASHYRTSMKKNYSLHP